MSGITDSIPWVFISAIVASTAAVFSALLNAYLVVFRHKSERLHRIALFRMEWAADVRNNAARYISLLSELSDAVRHQKEMRSESRIEDESTFSLEDAIERAFKLNKETVRKMYEAVHHLLLVLEADQRKKLQSWHNDAFVLIEEGDTYEADLKIEEFSDVISNIVDPELQKAAQEMGARSE